MKTDEWHIPDNNVVVAKRSGVEAPPESSPSAENILDSLAFYRHVFENANDVILVHDLAGRFLDVNEAACQRLGYTRDEMLNMGVKQLDTPENAARFDEGIRKFLQTDKMVLESCHRRKDGTCIPVEISARLIKFRGQPAVLSVVRDISERKRAEARIREQNAELVALTAQAQERATQLAAITELVHIVSSARALDEVFPVFAEQARRLVDYDRISIILFDPTTRQFVVRLVRDDSGNGPRQGMTMPCDEELVDSMQNTPHSIICPTPDGHERYPIGQAQAARMGVVTSLSLPLVIQNRLLGVLAFSRRREPLFQVSDEQLLLPVAKQLSIAMENARLQEQLQIMAIREERDRLGREMHDGLGQVLGSVMMRAGTVAELLRQGQVNQAQAMVEELMGTVQTASADAREAILGLRSSGGDTVGLEPALREYLQRYQCEWGIPCELQIADGTGLGCEPRSEVQLLRILQEALTNVRKHARASHVLLNSTCKDDWLTVTLSDDGCGFDSSVRQVDHFGLQTMRERAESVGGKLRIESALGAGTRVIVSLPCHGIRESAR